MCYPRNEKFKVITWSNLSEDKRRLEGNFRSVVGTCLAEETIGYDFTIVRVTGSVKYKYVGSRGFSSKLKLKRWGEKSDEVVDVVDLGELEGASDDFKMAKIDVRCSSEKSLWVLFEKGEMFSSCCHELTGIGFSVEYSVFLCCLMVSAL